MKRLLQFGFCLILMVMPILMINTATSPKVAIAQAPEDCPEGLTLQDCLILARYIETMAGVESIQVDSFDYLIGFSFLEAELGLVARNSGTIIFSEGEQDIQAADFNLVFDGVGIPDSEPSEPFNYRIVDNTLYFQQNEEWYGTELLPQLVEDQLFNPSDILSPTTLLMFFFENRDDYFWSRGSDVTIDGEPHAVFYIDVPLVELSTALNAINMAANFLADLIPLDLTGVLDALAIGQDVAVSTSVVLTQVISLETNTLRSSTAEISIDLSPVLFTELGVDESLSAFIPRPLLVFRIAGEYSNYNQAETIAPPAEWQPAVAVLFDELNLDELVLDLLFQALATGLDLE
jgi:hypothetical protein